MKLFNQSLYRVNLEKPLFELSKLNSRPRARNEATIRALCENAYLGGQSSLCRVLGRYKMVVDTDDVGLSSHLLLDGYWEMWVTEAIAAAVKPGMRAIDVGANLGYFTLLIADLCGPKGHVFAFEPNARMVERLRKSRDINGFYERVTIEQTALGDVDGQPMSFFIPEHEPKNARTIPVGPERAGEDDVILTRRLDSYPDIGEPDIIKIDADTAEFLIWRGMSGLLERCRKPLTIFLEFASVRYADPRGFLEEIVASGFSLARVNFRSGVETLSQSAILASPDREDQMLVLRRGYD